MSLQTQNFVEIGRMLYCDTVFQKSNYMAICVCDISERYMSFTGESFIFSQKATTLLIVNTSQTSG